MHNPIRGAAHTGRLMTLAACCITALAACSDQPVDARAARLELPRQTLQAFECEVSRTDGMHCQAAVPAGSTAPRAIIGGQDINVRLQSTDVTWDAGTEIFSMNVTVQNLLNEAMGTPDGVTPDSNGIMVFFVQDPATTSGSGDVTVEEPSGTAFFTSADQPYHTYSEILETNEVSGAKQWKFHMPAGVASFRIAVLVAAEMQYKLVINEVMVNPSPAVTLEGPYEWIELYNAGSMPVDLVNLVIADSAASGRRPYHQISSSVVVQPGGYAVLAGSTNTTSNGGVPADYAWGSALSLANSLDAVKIARVVGLDTLTLDRTQYSQSSISAVDSRSRELKNPALDNSNMDGSNWVTVSVTSVYGAGGNGTPKAQNSGYTP